jgi:hypothetical protein
MVVDATSQRFTKETMGSQFSVFSSQNPLLQALCVFEVRGLIFEVGFMVNQLLAFSLWPLATHSSQFSVLRVSLLLAAISSKMGSRSQQYNNLAI